MRSYLPIADSISWVTEVPIIMSLPLPMCSKFTLIIPVGGLKLRFLILLESSFMQSERKGLNFILLRMHNFSRFLRIKFEYTALFFLQMCFGHFYLKIRNVGLHVSSWFYFIHQLIWFYNHTLLFPLSDFCNKN